VLTTITAGSGLPESPLYFATVPGTANTCCIRANYTGAGIHVQSGNQYLNPLAYTAPTPGQWGNAARNSITGPNQFSLNSSLARTFRLTSRYNLFISVAATNTLNNVTFASYYNYVNNAALFGTPTSANPMRSIQLTGRLRF
jgi:hypothetical protein